MADSRTSGSVPGRTLEKPEPFPATTPRAGALDQSEPLPMKSAADTLPEKITLLVEDRDIGSNELGNVLQRDLL